MIKLRVKAILREKGLTQKDLADALDITEVGLSKSLSENGNPTITTLNKIAKALGVDFTELFESSNDNQARCPHCGTVLELKEK